MRDACLRHDGGPVAPNLLDQDFVADQPNQKWGADITYIWTAEGWLYLAIVLDLFSRRIIGSAMSDRMKKGLAVEALQRAITLRRPPRGVIHHSDRGSQYCSDDYRKLQKRHGFVVSMSGKGNCYDNAMVETVFKTLKCELIWRTAFSSRADARWAIGQYIDGFYNPRRRHSSLGYVSPATFETAFRAETPNRQRSPLNAGKSNQDIAIKRGNTKAELQQLLDADFCGLIIAMIHKFEAIPKDSSVRDNI